jgi:hypothetical protein
MIDIIGDMGFNRGSMDGEHDLHIGGLASIAQDLTRVLTGDEMVKVTEPMPHEKDPTDKK